MAEYIHLVGAEDVSRAASTIGSAARDMQSAASSMGDNLFRMQRLWEDQRTTLEDFVSRLEKIYATDHPDS